jgi:hypothetical protein
MRTSGLAFIVGAVLVNVPYMLLIADFEYPNVLRAPTGEILDRFAGGGNALIFTWLAFAWSAVPILVGIVLLRRILEEDDHPLAATATTFGVVGAIVQMIGLLRWVFVVPGLAEAHMTEGATQATRIATEVTFDAIHQYGGVVLGEHLGQAFTVAWIILVSAMMLRSRIFRPWLGWVGFAAGAVYTLSQMEIIATVIPNFPNWSAAGLVGSLLWLLWMTLLGLRLIARTRHATTDDSRTIPVQAAHRN